MELMPGFIDYSCFDCLCKVITAFTINTCYIGTLICYIGTFFYLLFTFISDPTGVTPKLSPEGHRQSRLVTTAEFVCYFLQGQLIFPDIAKYSFHFDIQEIMIDGFSVSPLEDFFHFTPVHIDLPGKLIEGWRVLLKDMPDQYFLNELRFLLICTRRPAVVFIFHGLRVKRINKLFLAAFHEHIDKAVRYQLRFFRPVMTINYQHVKAIYAEYDQLALKICFTKKDFPEFIQQLNFTGKAELAEFAFTQYHIRSLEITRLC
jgi:hypothetical protein